MNTIFSTLYGSRLFGCAIPESDEDFKHIHLETLSDLLYSPGQVRQNKIETETSKIEHESYPLKQYLTMLGKGNVIATDMFFAPKKFWAGAPSPLWEDILTLKDSIITRNLASFVGYARSQAFKYGKKGVKLQTVQTAIRLLEEETPFARVCSELKGLEGVRYTTEHAAGGDIEHIEICGKDFGETTRYALWLEPLRRLEVQYGERARLSTSGLDLKAQMHTVRICCEAIELLTTGSLTFPRPEAPLLLKIREGTFQDSALRDLVDARVIDLEACTHTSTLPEKPDWDIINDFIYCAERDFIVNKSTVSIQRTLETTDEIHP